MCQYEEGCVSMLHLSTNQGFAFETLQAAFGMPISRTLRYPVPSQACASLGAGQVLEPFHDPARLCYFRTCKFHRIFEVGPTIKAR